MNEELKKMAYTGDGILKVIKHDESMLSYYKNKICKLDECELLRLLDVCKAAHNRQWLYATILINVYGVQDNLINML